MKTCASCMDHKPPDQFASYSTRDGKVIIKATCKSCTAAKREQVIKEPELPQHVIDSFQANLAMENYGWREK